MLRWGLTGADAEKVVTEGNAAHDLTGVYETGKETIVEKADRINNIYDLEGNAYELTAEAYFARYRGLRGGTYHHRGGNRYPSSRSDTSPTNANDSTCSRLVLYIK